MFMSVGWCYNRAAARVSTGTSNPDQPGGVFSDAPANGIVAVGGGGGVEGAGGAAGGIGRQGFGTPAVYFGLFNGSQCYAGFVAPSLHGRVEEEWCDVACPGYAMDTCEFSSSFSDVFCLALSYLWSERGSFWVLLLLTV
jgi:hypothetical protein